MAKKQKLSSLTDMEWVIMGAVWDQEPCTADTVQEALGKEHAWAHSTVKATMDRIVVKGLLTCRMIRNLN